MLVTLANAEDVMLFGPGMVLVDPASGRAHGITRFKSIDHRSGAIELFEQTSFEKRRAASGKPYIGPSRFSYPATQRKRMFREMGMTKWDLL